MLEYEFETVDCTGGSGYSFLGGIGLETVGYREILRRRAQDGWRYLGCIPRTQRAEGFIETLDLVFGRDTPRDLQGGAHGSEAD
jgi:hypothetical protein